MRRRDFLKLAVGGAVAAAVLPEVAKAVITPGTKLTALFPEGMYVAYPAAGDLIVRTATGLDVYSADCVFKGIYRP